MKLHKLTFRQQLRLCLGADLLFVLLSLALGQGWFHNLHFLVWGLLFLWNPVWSEDWLNIWPEKRRLGIRIGAGLLLWIGLFGRFGVSII